MAGLVSEAVAPIFAYIKDSNVVSRHVFERKLHFERAGATDWIGFAPPAEGAQAAEAAEAAKPGASAPSSSAAAAPVAAPAVELEVERKFNFSTKDAAALAAAVLAMGGERRGQKRFVDEYLDTPDFALSRQDWWLRLRGGVGLRHLQLKVPNIGACSSGGHAVYDELAGLAVLRRLAGAGHVPQAALASFESSAATEGSGAAATPPTPPAEAAESSEALKRALGLCTLGRFETTRQMLRLGRVSVDLDSTDFEYSVGELEVLCKHAAEVPAARRDIDLLMARLRIAPQGRQAGRGGGPPSKLHEHSRLHNPRHFAAMCEVGIWGPRRGDRRTANPTTPPLPQPATGPAGGSGCAGTIAAK